MRDSAKRIELAPQDRLAAVEAWAPRFFAEVLRHDYSDCLVTDESDMRDFLEGEHQVAFALDRFRAHYFLEPPPSETRIVAMLEFLRDRDIAA